MSHDGYHKLFERLVREAMDEALPNLPTKFHQALVVECVTRNPNIGRVAKQFGFDEATAHMYLADALQRMKEYLAANLWVQLKAEMLNIDQWDNADRPQK